MGILVHCEQIVWEGVALALPAGMTVQMSARYTGTL